MSLAIPELPRSVRASSLLNGSNADFIINAYLALQHQWPDTGGFGHYFYLLGQRQVQRAQVLREIATSDNARRCGVRFIDDLPLEHEFHPEHHDHIRLAEVSLSLRVGRAVADIDQLRQSISRLATDELNTGVESIIHAQQGHQALLESRLNTMEAVVQSLRGAASHSADATIDSLAQAVQSLAHDIAHLKDAFAHLHHYTTVELKRQVADYVNAVVDVSRPKVVATAPEAPRQRPQPPVRAGTRQNARAGGAPHG